ncbi:efflux RND transporter periplasmic adaptor subunit [Rubripirellula amarantea]|uniref:Macrolide export protein MacA n=1 Tax=Rubripirellula amarantea TaxID=2527999 RepID=A0A5C5WKD4_9BACT|nr:efflux RND transporter periplasmic adaptor subunit [Rubripirellula amarantea]MDA8744621.1 efflux RND transporter periplasmic adaptor subunit [Rubripirellula amarantea]TWT51110.1 Macrolide export protein MacA [Rubripirellula amarantea]
MKAVLKTVIVLSLLGVAAAYAYKPAKQYLADRNKVSWETAEIEKGDITRYVNSTGTIEPVLSVSIGSFVSGPIVELNVDFNDYVKEGDVLARVDPRLFKANVDRDEATLATRQAELERVEAQLRQSLNNYMRGKKLRGDDKDFMSDREMDALTYEVKSLQAQRKLAKASIQQAAASLETSRANLNYCEVTAPVDGVVIDRKINPGQTLAAQFQTPELFIIAPDLRKKMHVFASVDEADIGLIQDAKDADRPVTFTVDAHPDEVFDGEIEQIRVSSVATSNVVTYPVVIATKNPDMKLLPGMTASISFEVDSTTDVPKIPNAALRFFPDDVMLVRESDRHLIDGSAWKSKPKTDAEEDENANQTATEKAAAEKKKNERHVWVVDGDHLKAVAVTIGLTENRFTEMAKGDLKVGDKVVTGKKD